MVEIALILVVGISVGLTVASIVEDITWRRALKHTKHCSRCQAWTQEHYGAKEGQA